MLTAGKFLSGSLVLGTLTVLGAALIQTSNNGRLHLQGPVASVLLAQTACQRLDSVSSAITAEVSPYLHDFPERFRAFVSANATTARLQYEGMRNDLIAQFHLGTWLPSTKTDLLQAGSEQARSQTKALAAKMPMTQAAHTSVGHMVQAAPAFHLGF
jgi:hypothetical protein